MAPAFDYDTRDIASAYASARGLTPVRERVWAGHLRSARGDGDVRHVIDLGCGVGRFVPLLREVFRARVYGIDPSARMLAAASAGTADTAITWLRAAAEALPVAGARIDLVFLYLVYHHLRDPLAALRECARVLVPGGRLLVVNATVDILDSLRWLPFFPSARPIDAARLPARAQVAETARRAGLTLLGQRPVADPVAPGLRAYAERVASRTFSTLQLVPDREFADGVAAFRRHCEGEDCGQVVEEVIDTFLFRR
jgi:SAM-dependent methyltransferase